MRAMHTCKTLRSGAIATAALAAIVGAAWAGDLNPPAGPVAPTMKNLDFVEPRVPIGPATTPGDADALFKISQPGSYYFTGNVTGVAAKYGIEVAADNVTIDLMGFTFQGVVGSFDGISDTFVARTGVTVRNGTLANWGVSGVALGFTTSAVVENVTSRNNPGNTGISVGDGSIVRGCIAHNNAGQGIGAGRWCRIERCIVRQNNFQGILTGDSGHVVECTAQGNTGIGIQCGFGGVVERCLAEGSTGGGGINVSFSGAVRDCRARGNAGPGISCATGVSIVNNVSTDNTGAMGFGIHLVGVRNYVQGNLVVSNVTGIKADMGSNTVVGNSASGNTTHYDVGGSNVFGPVVTSITVGANTNPSANYQH